MKLKRSQIIVTGITTLVAGYLTWWIFLSGDIFFTHTQNAVNRAALVRLQDDINLGASYSDVLPTYWRLRTLHLRLYAEDPAKWVISTPFEPFEDNWELWIEFSNGRVTGLRVRTPDELIPRDGPADKREQHGSPAGAAPGVLSS